MEVHGLCVAGGQDEGCAFAVLGTDRSEDVGRGGALIVWRAGARPAPRPSAGDLVFLADPRFVGEPDLFCGCRPWCKKFLIRCAGDRVRSSVRPLDAAFQKPLAGMVICG
jgi:hypothetical protein